jgi:hypothetical protein
MFPHIFPFSVDSYPDCLQKVLKAKFESFYETEWRSEYQEIVDACPIGLEIIRKVGNKFHLREDLHEQTDENGVNVENEKDIDMTDNDESVLNESVQERSDMLSVSEQDGHVFNMSEQDGQMLNASVESNVSQVEQKNEERNENDKMNSSNSPHNLCADTDQTQLSENSSSLSTETSNQRQNQLLSLAEKMGSITVPLNLNEQPLGTLTVSLNLDPLVIQYLSDVSLRIKVFSFYFVFLSILFFLSFSFFLLSFSFFLFFLFFFLFLYYFIYILSILCFFRFHISQRNLK